MKSWVFIFAGLLIMGLGGSGCSTPRGLYEDAYETVSGYDQPDSDEAEDAFEDLNEAITVAKEDLRQQDHSSPCLHDQTAYFIPLAHLAKARLHGRFGQMADQEEACWEAIRESDIYLGAHIRRFQPTNRSWGLMYNSYSAFFRREKIRRHAFILLKETYRQAGERDLEILMATQIRFSDIYLRSPVAHKEEEYIRTIENADWVRLYDGEIEDIGHGVKMFFMTITLVAAQAAGQMQQAELQQQQSMTNDPALKANLQNQINNLDQVMMQNMEQTMEAMRKMEEGHMARLEAIESRFQDTVIGALMANFEMLELSDEVKNLPAYNRLMVTKAFFDDYVLNNGFDNTAARALVDIRTSLDDLTQALQQRRRING